MPRESAASLAVAPPADFAERRVLPPDNLPEPARLIWREIVEALPGNRFHRSDRPLLALYCRALHQAELAFLKIEQHGATAGDAVNPSVRVLDSALKQVATLATKLRLCPQARLDRKPAGRAARHDDGAPRPWQP
jgi:P27 family predicted phage terminase small subunit